MIATVLNFCSYDALFLRQCLEEVAHFSKEVVVVVCDHLFDGSQENRNLLNGIYAAHPEVQFIEYPFSETNFYADHSPHFWHNLSRLVGFSKTAAPYVLFLDVDEIVEGAAFKEWLSTLPLEEYGALRLACHWYFREPSLRATTLEDTPLLIRRETLPSGGLMHAEERAGTFSVIAGKKLRYACGDPPLVHHYSWVRDKRSMLRKVSTWGHRAERDWSSLIEEEFAGSFSGRDFVHGYEYVEVDSRLKPAAYAPSERASANVTKLTTSQLHALDLEHCHLLNHATAKRQQKELSES